MPLSFLGAPSAGTYADAAAAIPEALLAKKDLDRAAAALEFLASTITSSGGFGLIPTSATDSRVDPFANLWFIRAAHLFAAAGGNPALSAKILQLSKRILQDFISGNGVAGVKMDDGGLLLSGPDQPPGRGLRLNALWYSALESTADDLKAAGDKGGDHFERLSGRFRRAFAKSFWCDGHNCICPPYRRTPESHGDIPDAEQLLLTILPSSPIPRTKQRQLLQAVRTKSLPGTSNGSVGLMIDHPTLGRVESPLHRAWLAIGILEASDDRETSMPEALAAIAPLENFLNGTKGLAAHYKDGKPVGEPDPLTTAQARSAVHHVRGNQT